MSQEQKLAALKSQNTNRFLAFSLCGNEYCLELSKVKEVIALTEIRAVPYTPPHFKGIMNLRGQVISVIDLRLKLKLPKADPSPETSIIILDLSPLTFGIIVDSVDSVLHVQNTELKPPPEFATDVKSDHIHGVVQREKKLVLVLDIEKALDVEDLRALRQQEIDQRKATEEQKQAA